MMKLPRRRVVLSSLFLTLIVFAVSGNAVPPLISAISASTGVRVSDFGALISVQFIAFAVASFSGSSIKYRLHLTNYALISGGIVVIAAAFGLGSVVLSSYLSLVLWIIPLGLAGGFVETFASIEIADLSDDDSSKNLCLANVFFSIGAFSAPQMVYVSLVIGLHWEEILLVFSAFCALVVLLFLLANHRFLRSERHPTVADSDEHTNHYRHPTPAVRALYVAMLAMMLCYVTLESLSAAWFSYVFESSYGLTTRDAALALALFWGGTVAGRALVLFLPTRLTLWPTLLAASSLMLVGACTLWFLEPVAASLISVAAFGVAAGPMWPVIVMTAAATFKSDHKTAVLIGIGAIGFASGPFVGSYFVGPATISAFHVVQILMAVVLVALTFGGYALHTVSARKSAGVGNAT